MGWSEGGGGREGDVSQKRETSGELSACSLQLAVGGGEERTYQ